MFTAIDCKYRGSNSNGQTSRQISVRFTLSARSRPTSLYILLSCDRLSTGEVLDDITWPSSPRRISVKSLKNNTLFVVALYFMCVTGLDSKNYALKVCYSLNKKRYFPFTENRRLWFTTSKMVLVYLNALFGHVHYVLVQEYIGLLDS